MIESFEKVPRTVFNECVIFQMHIINYVKVCPEALKKGPIWKIWTFLDSARQSDSGNLLFDFLKSKFIDFELFIKCTW